MSVYWNGFSQQTTVSVHLIVSRSDAAVWQQTISPVHSIVRSRVQFFWHQKTISSMHLIVRSQMQPLWHHTFDAQSTSFSPLQHSTANAFDDIDIRCSPDNQTAVKASDRFTIECSISGINSLPAHSSIAASHSFDHFLTSSRTVDRLPYTFISSSFLEKDINHQHFDQGSSSNR